MKKLTFFQISGIFMEFLEIKIIKNDFCINKIKKKREKRRRDREASLSLVRANHSLMDAIHSITHTLRLEETD